MKYTIGFKSGSIIEIDVLDGVKFVEYISAEVEQNQSSASIQWHVEPGKILAVSEFEFVMASDICVKKNTNL